MEPQVIDYYNEMPMGINVIEKMNEEFIELQKENNILKEKLEEYDKLLKKFQMPRIKIDTVGEYQLFNTKLEEFEEFVAGESPKYSFIDFHNHYYNYGLSDDVMPGPGCIEDENGIIYKLINKLDELTYHRNREWCQCRILTSIEMFIKGVHSEIEVNLSDIITGINNDNDDDQLPIIYCELSNYFKPEWSEREEHHNIWNIPYYNCEKCGKLDDYGEPENIDNKLLCGDCFWDYCD